MSGVHFGAMAPRPKPVTITPKKALAEGARFPVPFLFMSVSNQGSRAEGRGSRVVHAFRQVFCLTRGCMSGGCLAASAWLAAQRDGGGGIARRVPAPRRRGVQGAEGGPADRPGRALPRPAGGAVNGQRGALEDASRRLPGE